MTEIDAIRERHSVRNYMDKPILENHEEQLQEKIKELNRKGNLHLQYLRDAGNTYSRFFNKAMGHGSAPGVIACIGEDAPDLEERVGYYGEQLVLYAQQIGLNTCWVGMFNRKGIPVQLQEKEKLVITIAIGYGENRGKQRKSKRAEQVVAGTNDKPFWFNFGVQMALLAPTAMNQQKFQISYLDDGTVEFKDKGGPFSKIDLGIVKYHFEAGAEYEKAKICKE